MSISEWKTRWKWNSYGFISQINVPVFSGEESTSWFYCIKWENWKNGETIKAVSVEVRSYFSTSAILSLH